jgi:hypothetical protein
MTFSGRPIAWPSASRRPPWREHAQSKGNRRWLTYPGSSNAIHVVTALFRAPAGNRAAPFSSSPSTSTLRCRVSGAECESTSRPEDPAAGTPRRARCWCRADTASWLPVRALHAAVGAAGLGRPQRRFARHLAGPGKGIVAVEGALGNGRSQRRSLHGRVQVDRCQRARVVVAGDDDYGMGNPAPQKTERKAHGPPTVRTHTGGQRTSRECCVRVVSGAYRYCGTTVLRTPSEKTTSTARPAVATAAPLRRTKPMTSPVAASRTMAMG